MFYEFEMLDSLFFFADKQRFGDLNPDKKIFIYRKKLGNSFGINAVLNDVFGYMEYVKIYVSLKLLLTVY